MSIPAICITGWANSGKTTLIEALLADLTARGLRVGVIKHSHHTLAMDTAGKDTARYRTAGAQAVALAAADGAAMLETGDKRLTDMLSRVRDVDLILVEGYDREACLPMLEVWRDGARPMRAPAQWRRAVVSELPYVGELPVFKPQDTAAIADFVFSLAREQQQHASARVSVQLDGQDISTVPFVQRLVENVSRGLLSTLDGYREGCEVVIRIGAKE